jgi:hypothetical protein
LGHPIAEKAMKKLKDRFDGDAKELLEQVKEIWRIEKELAELRGQV